MTNSIPLNKQEITNISIAIANIAEKKIDGKWYVSVEKVSDLLHKYHAKKTGVKGTK